jgi:hypothetical protein
MKCLIILCLALFFCAQNLLYGSEIQKRGSIVLVTKFINEEDHVTIKSKNVTIVHGENNSAERALKMLGDPKVLFETYRCEKLIVVLNGSGIKENKNLPLSKIIASCTSDFNVFFVIGDKIILDNNSINVASLPFASIAE